MIRQIREAVARRRGVELESGFTLIELLIVIVVLGILAATVIFALSGVTGQSAQAACQSDAKSYQIAAAAFQNNPSNASNTPADTTADLTGSANGGPFLHQAANNSAYVIALAGDPASVLGTSTLPSGAVAGDVYVGAPGHALINYDSETSTTGCQDPLVK
jgi:prepilin-type N-terminal cleavage/methylation domain-containing protein